MKQTIFVVEDDRDIAQLVRHHLEGAGFGVRVFPAATSVIAEAEKHAPALFLLDVMVPGGDGFALCTRIRERQALAGTPVIFLTARTSEADRVAGLELGADDYVTKPFSPRELVARVRAVLRRTQPGTAEERPIQVGALCIDPGPRDVSLDGRAVSLTPREFGLLLALAGSPGRVFSRQQLLHAVFGPDSEALDRTVDAHVMNLRRKLGEDASGVAWIQTVFGVGYRLTRANRE